MTIDNQKRVDHAVALFMHGYNCSQSVVAAFADLYGLTEQQALRVSAGFGGGIGRMRETCGAFCGATLLAGLDCGATEGADREGKSHCYKVVQHMAEKYKARNGSLICAEILGLKGAKAVPLCAEASERTPEYYKSRPCAMKVKSAAVIFAEYLEDKKL